MQLCETLAVTSVEGFLDSATRELLLGMVAEQRYSIISDGSGPGGRSRSIHHVEGVSTADTMSAYEPCGRVEIHPLAGPIQAVLDQAWDRAVESVQRSLPSVGIVDGWTYVEYRSGQYIRPHADYLGAAAEGRSATNNLVDLAEAQIAGISVTLDDDYEGGEFFVETSSSNALWRQDRPALLADGVHPASTLLNGMKRTQWLVRPEAGTALLYGSQLIHGTRPVVEGCARKFIGFLRAGATAVDERA